jgi:hypothetical protein
MFSRRSSAFFHSRETGKIDLLQLPEASSVSAWHFLQFSMRLREAKHLFFNAFFGELLTLNLVLVETN